MLCRQRFTNQIASPPKIKIPAFSKVTRLTAILGAFFSPEELESIGYDPSDNRATDQFFKWLAQPHLNRGNFATEVRVKQLEDQVKQLSQSKEELEKQIAEMRAEKKGKRKREEPPTSVNKRLAVDTHTASPATSQPMPSTAPHSQELPATTTVSLPGSFWSQALRQ